MQFSDIIWIVIQLFFFCNPDYDGDAVESD